MKSTLSPKELAEAIAVSESSIKRWVDGGSIQATKTTGGHRRIALPEAVRFIRETKSVLVKPQVLGLTDLDSGLLDDSVATESTDDLLYEYLIEGASEKVRGLLISQYLAGRSLAHIVDQPLRSAMERLGELWKHERRGIYWEHRATAIAIQAVSQLRMLLPRAEDPPVAVGCAPSGDPYELPTMCAAAVLESEGYSSVNLGPDTPLSTFALAIETLEVSLAWLSVSVVENEPELTRELQRVLSNLESKSVPIVVGGSQVRRTNLPVHKSLHVAHSMAELAALVKGLRLASTTSGTRGVSVPKNPDQ